MASFEMDGADSFVGPGSRGGDRIAKSGHREDATAGRNHAAVLPTSAGMKNLHVAGSSTVQAGDWFADFIFFRVTARCHHDGHRRPFVPFDLCLAELSINRRLQ